MKETINFQNKSTPDPNIDGHQLLVELLGQIFSTDNDWILRFSQAFELHQIELGDELADGLEHDAADRGQPTSGKLYILCLGRIRLIGINDHQQETPVASLEAGEIWGVDQLLNAQPRSYKAVVSSPGIVATLAFEQLQTWLQQVPALKAYLQNITQSRQRLIFFKLATELRSQSSHVIKRLLPKINNISIPAGTTLAEATPAGRYWLYQGQIHSQSNGADGLPNVGDSWGYPEPVPLDWVATSDLQVYGLSLADWELLQPLLVGIEETQSAASGGPASHQVHRKALHRQLFTRDATQLSPTKSAAAPGQATHQPQLALQPEPASIDFAHPARGQYRRRWFGPNYPFIPQQSTADCGAACLAMVAQYWGKRLNLNMLRNLAGVGRSGASLKGLANAAERLGFQSRPVRSSFNRLAEQPLPWIAHWQGDHYVVVYRVKGKRVIMSDPALGRRSISVTEFQANWTGYALLLSPTELLKTIPSSKPTLGRFWSAFWPYRSMLWPILLASLLLQVFGLITPLFTQIILDRVIVNKSLISLQVFSIGLLMFGFWSIGLSGIRQYMLDYFSNQIDLTLVSGFVSHALNLPLPFFATRHVGDIITRVQENQKIQQFLTRQAVSAWLDAIMAVVYIGLMLYYNWQLTLLVLALLPPIIILTVVASPFLRRVSRQIFYESAKQNSTLVEMLTGIATVKATAAERDLRWQWEEQLTGMVNAMWRGQKLANGLGVVSTAINTMGSTALLWYGATLVIQDQLTIGQFVAFNMMIGKVLGPVLALVGLWDELQEVRVSVERLDDIFSTKPEESADQPLLMLPNIRGEVAFENVSFRYDADDDRNILQNITFQIKPGETMAIVGRSGSGKTTLVNLLQGLYHPTSGRVTIDDNDLRHVSPHSLRSQMGVVPQECYLFSGTILDNITLYRPEYSLAEVTEVAKLAEAHGFIQNLTLGYNTKVGERGTMLSGGQRQRIAIARALISDPRILILDEATSSLDTESERRFQKNLQHISRDRTTFIIAHRLSTVRNASCILVLDRGVIVEQGTHAQLMAKSGLYAQLAQQQLNI